MDLEVGFIIAALYWYTNTFAREDCLYFVLVLEYTPEKRAYVAGRNRKADSRSQGLGRCRVWKARRDCANAWRTTAICHRLALRPLYSLSGARSTVASFPEEAATIITVMLCVTRSRGTLPAIVSTCRPSKGFSAAQRRSYCSAQRECRCQPETEHWRQRLAQGPAKGRKAELNPKNVQALCKHTRF
jgi:hypothetical protein